MEEEGGVNVYVFVKNFPLNATDYLGMQCCLLRWKGVPGHVALSCDGGVYVSKYPDDSRGRIWPQPPRYRTPEEDLERHGQPDETICTGCLVETDLIREWFNSAACRNDPYHWPNPNCVGSVMDAILRGLPSDWQTPPNLKDCPCATGSVRKLGLVPCIYDLLDESGLKLPSDAARTFRMLNGNNCERYKCGYCLPSQL